MRGFCCEVPVIDSDEVFGWHEGHRSSGRLFLKVIRRLSEFFYGLSVWSSWRVEEGCLRSLTGCDDNGDGWIDRGGGREWRC